MRFDRFHICLCYYHYLSQTYEGQFSVKYARLSRLLRYFRPGFYEATFDNCDEDVRADVEALIARDESEAGR